MPEVRLSAGPVDYVDTGGTGPVVVLVHGVVMDGSLWREVVADLRGDHRCVVPTLPLGAHRRPMDPAADLSLLGQVRLLAEFLDALGLTDVVLVGNDWGGPHMLVPQGLAGRVGRLVLVSCEAFDNLPPGLPGRMLGLSARLPGGLSLTAWSLRVPPLRRLPLSFGWMAKRPIPADVVDGWMRSLRTQAAVRRDFRKYARGIPPKRDLIAATEALRDFDRPTLVVWAAEDKVMPPEHGRRLAELLPRGRLVEIADSYTLVPLDQPARLAGLLRDFARDGGESGSGAGGPTIGSAAEPPAAP
jgi:pimeloyl-ACP methyl ester carboxylesterase